MNNEAIYWLALAHLPKWGYAKINRLIVKFFHDEKITIEEFFNLSEAVWMNNYQLDAKDVTDLQKAKSELANTAFFAENLLSQGYELIPITSPDYSKTLKNNLKVTHSPSLLYVKGNKHILQEKSVAIVGSRAADEISLAFTDNIAQKASKDYKVVVSGFAKGVDKQALDSAIKYQGQSIIVLPQGITTFNSGFKTYYKQIVNGDVLVLSTFHPKSTWSTGLAMARNPIIYGLADEIFVAESSEKGGTWSGVMDGLKKGRKIFVRMPSLNEKNANMLLIQKGATAVDFEGNETSPGADLEPSNLGNIPTVSTVSGEVIKERILAILNSRPQTVKEIHKILGAEWTTQQLSKFLNSLEEIQPIKSGRTITYSLKSNLNNGQATLFG